MFKFVTGLSLVILSATVVWGIGKYWRQSTGAPVYVGPDCLSLGNVEAGATNSVRVPIANAGRQNLILTNFSASCGCMAFENSGQRIGKDDSLTIGPGKTEHLEVSIRALGSAGIPRVDLVRFASNDPNNPVCTVQLQSNLKGYLYAQPQSISELQMSNGQQEVRQIRIVDAGVDGVTAIHRIVSDLPEVVQIANWGMVQQQGKLDDSERTIANMTLCIVPPKDNVRVDAKVSFYADGSDVPYGVIPVAVRSQPDVLVSPSVLFLPRTVEGQPCYECRCLVRRRDGKPFRMTVESDLPDLKADLIAESMQAPVKVVVVRTNQSARGKATVRIRAIADENTQEAELVVHNRESNP